MASNAGLGGAALDANAGSATRTAAPASKGNLIMTLAPGFSNNKRRKWRGFAGFDEKNIVAFPSGTCYSTPNVCSSPPELCDIGAMS